MCVSLWGWVWPVWRSDRCYSTLMTAVSLYCNEMQSVIDMYAIIHQYCNEDADWYCTVILQKIWLCFLHLNLFETLFYKFIYLFIINCSIFLYLHFQPLKNIYLKSVAIHITLFTYFIWWVLNSYCYFYNILLFISIAILLEIPKIALKKSRDYT